MQRAWSTIKPCKRRSPAGSRPDHWFGHGSVVSSAVFLANNAVMNPMQALLWKAEHSPSYEALHLDFNERASRDLRGGVPFAGGGMLWMFAATT